MSIARGNLKPAHAGYIFQDTVTAYCLLKLALGNYDQVSVDIKKVEDDRFDDLELIKNKMKTRIQVKSSLDKNMPLSHTNFTYKNDGYNLRVDRLVRTFKQETSPISEFRLLATWQKPTTEDDLSNYILAIDAIPTLPISNVHLYKLNANSIWPKSQKPIWKQLCVNTDITRDDFLKFCEVFILELCIPNVSLDLNNPNQVENAILSLLTDNIGIGRYPNTDRTARDVAALTFALAAHARTQERTITAQDVLKALEIRIDFGRISQSFPLDPKYLYDKPTFRENILDLNIDSKILLITGPPGIGKSWALTDLAHYLANDFIVARHYCYLEPGDELVEKRITTDVLFANLIADLHKVCGLNITDIQRFSADLTTLELTLEQCSKLGKLIILIVDGLDHISRVKESSNTLSDNETDIVEQLATLDLPKNVKIIIGSQPGTHLLPILNRKDVKHYELPTWKNQEILGLCKIHKVQQTLVSVGIKNHSEILASLADKIDGNPLYATYISKTLVTGLEDSTIIDPADWIQTVPDTKGNIEVYYDYLYQKLVKDVQSIADVLGVLEFSVTQDELKELAGPYLSRWVKPAMSAIKPVVINIAGQGGLRIFHESFRRFIFEKLAEEGTEVSEILQPVITWLKNKGFYRNARSYRFLLPALRQAGRAEDIFDICSFDFVSTSISHGHSEKSIQSNIALTANVASQIQNWPVLVRCVELRRSLFSCFYDNEDWHYFWASYAELFGYQSLSERLLFDGKPTLDFGTGIKACLVVDDLGGTPPWKEYLALPHDYNESYYSHRFDVLYEMRDKEFCILAQLQCDLSAGRGFSVLKWAAQYLSQINNSNISFYFVRAFSYRLSRNGLDKTAIRLAQRFGSLVDSNIVRVALELGIADYYAENGQKDIARKHAQSALEVCSSPILISMCIDHNAIPLTTYNLPFSVCDLDLSLGTTPTKGNDIRKWVHSIRVITHINSSDPILNKELERIKGSGWYRCWLKFVIEIFRAETSLSYNICSIFNILLEQTHPFSGSPRACDLYYIEKVIERTIAIGLTLVKSETEWKNILDTLVQVHSNISTRIHQEDGGPLSIATIISLLTPYIKNDNVGQLILKTIEKQINFLKQRGTYYSTYADHEINLSTFYARLGDDNKAKDCWYQAGIYLTSYGLRKDVTLFEIIESVSVYSSASEELLLKSLDKLQPCIYAVLRHTDGKETKHTPNKWFNELFDATTENAIEVLVRTIQEENYIESWPTLKALGYVARESNGKADPMLVNALWDTLPIKVEYDNYKAKIAPQIRAIDKLHKADVNLAKNSLMSLASKVANDNTKDNCKSIDFIENYSQDLGLSIKGHFKLEEQENNVSQSYVNTEHPTLNQGYLPPDNLPFPEHANLTDLLRGIRKISDNEDHLIWLSVYLSYKLEEMVANGSENESTRIIFFLAKEIGFFKRSDALRVLAECLELIGKLELATAAYTLAYAYSNGQGGWTVIGDDKQAFLLDKAINLNKKLAKQILANNIEYRLRESDYGSGLSKALIERAHDWGGFDTALECWDEAFNVISHRLPIYLPSQHHSYFAKFDHSNLIDWDINEGLIALLLFRLSEPRLSRKLAALSGIINAIKYQPQSCIKPLLRFITTDTPITSLMLVFSTLVNFESNPFLITQGISDILKLYLNSNIWGVKVLSSQLFDRANITYSSRTISYNRNPLSTRNLRYVYEIDYTHSLGLLSQFQPDLPYRVEQGLDNILPLEANRDRWLAVTELSKGRDGKDFPPVDTLDWSFELFFSTLHQEAMGIKEGMWKMGLWSKEHEQYLVNETLPDIDLRLGLYHSRIPRPPLLSPTDIVAGKSSIHIIDEQSEYDGWVRLAYLETQFLNSAEHSFSRPDSVVQVFSSIVLTPTGILEPKAYFPFVNQESNVWQPGTEPCHYLSRPCSIWTNLVGLFHYKDWFGTVLVLTPPPEIAYILDATLTINENDILAWLDENNEEVIRLRCWEVRSEQLSSESPKLIGMDLVIKPDVFKRLEGFFNCPMTTYTIMQDDCID